MSCGRRAIVPSGAPGRDERATEERKRLIYGIWRSDAA